MESNGSMTTMDLLGRTIRSSGLITGLRFTAGTEGEFFVVTPDTIRRMYFNTQELIVGKPAAGWLEVDGVGGGVGLAVFEPLRFATRGNVTWLGSHQSVRRIARDGTTTSIPTDLGADSIAVDDHHVYLFNDWKTELRRIPLDGGVWEPLPYQPEAAVTFLGTLNDGRITFLENRRLKFLDPSTGNVLPEQQPFPRMTSLTLDPNGGVFGEVSVTQSPMESAGDRLLGVLHYDFASRRLTRVGPPALVEQNSWTQAFTTTTRFLTGNAERQYSVSVDGPQVFVNEGFAWVPHVGRRKTPVVAPGPLPANVNTITGAATLDNGDLVLFDTAENVVLVVE